MGQRVSGQGSVVMGQWSEVIGQGSSVTSRCSRVTGQRSLARVKGHCSLVKGQWSLVKPFSIIRPYTNPIKPKVWKFGRLSCVYTGKVSVSHLARLAVFVARFLWDYNGKSLFKD